MSVITYVPVPSAADTSLMTLRPIVTPRIVTNKTQVESFIHPGAIVIAFGGYGLFLIASWTGWAFGYTSMLIMVIYGLSVMYFGMLVFEI